jgi:hypothetical protein
LLLLLFLVPTSTAKGYITVPVQTLGAALAESTYVTVMKVEKFDREKGLIVYNKVKDLKGKYPRDKVRHLFRLKDTPAHKGQGDVPVRPNEIDWNYALKWVEEGKIAVVFSRKYDPYGVFGHAYIDGLWYAMMCPAEDWDLWYAIYSDGNLLSQWYAGKPADLPPAIETMLAGRQAYVPVLGKGTKADLRAGKATLYTLGAVPGVRVFDRKSAVLEEPLDKNSIPKFQKILKEGGPRDTRAQAAGALGLLGAEAKSAVDSLLDSVQKDSSGTVRMAAAEALIKIGVEAKTLLPIIETTLKDPAMSQRLDVQKAFKEFRDKVK